MNKIKRFLITGFMALMMITSAVAVTSCSTVQDFADNNLHKQVTISGKAPTCTEDGFTDKVYCPGCGKIYKDHEVIPALGHTVVVDEAVAATCTKTGWTEGNHCSVCNEVLVAQELVATKEHTPVADVAVDATCTETGLTEGSHCADCNAILVEQETVSVKDHTYTPVVTAPTCTEKGYTTYTCECGDSYMENYVDVVDHTYTPVVTAPTCTEKGYTTYTCKCGDSYVADYVDVVDHTYTPVVTAPTCTDKGYTTYTCGCGASYVADYVDVVDHTYAPVVTDPTCTTKGYTTYTCGCGASYVNDYTDANGHTEEEIPAVKETCTEAGKTAGQKCSVCDAILVEQEEIPAHHTEESIPAVAATCISTGLTEGKKCSVCGETTVEQTEVPKAAHTEKKLPAVAATCVTTGLTEGTRCSVCGETLNAQKETDMVAHTEESIPAVEATCTSTGLTEGTKCSVCGAILEAQKVTSVKAHEYKPTVTAPTCTETGYTTYTCVCGASYVGDRTPANGHTWNDGVVTKDPTETEEGKMLYTCTVEGCEVTKEVNIGKLDHVHTYFEKWSSNDANHWHAASCGHDVITDNAAHDWDDGEVTTEPTCTEEGVKTYKCTVCESATKTEKEIAALGHDWADATCTEPKSCKREGCDATEGEALGHIDENKDHICDRKCGKEDMGTHADSETDTDHVCDYCKSNEVLENCSDVAGDKDHNCDICGKENVSEHSYSDATCESPATCSECNTTTGSALGHIDEDKDHICDRKCGKEDMGTHADSETDTDHVCDYCKSNEVLEDCSDVAGDKDHNCDVCGKENVSEHSYSDATCESPATCSECNTTTGSALGHIDEDKDHICDRKCGKEDMGTHADSTTDDDHVCDYCKSNEVLEDCSDVAGDKDHNCDVCGKENVSEHSYSDATCESPATCFECNTTKGEALNHIDEDKDHICDRNCGKEDMGTHADSATDNDHICDYCKSNEVLEDHKEGEGVVDDETKVEATWTEDGSYDTVVYCSVCGKELSRVTTTVDALNKIHYAKETDTITDAGTWHYWNDSKVVVTKALYADSNKTSVTFTYNTTEDTDWYGMQLFYKHSANEVGKNYILTCTIDSEVEGNITINGQVISLVKGTNNIKLLVTEIDGKASFSLQCGTYDPSSFIKENTLSISNLTFTEFELTSATLGTDIKLDERNGKVYFVVAGGTYEYEANEASREDIEVALTSALKSYFYFDVQNNPNEEGGLEGYTLHLENAHVIILGENNTFELAVDLSSLENNALTMHLAPESLRTSQNGWNDFKPDVEVFKNKLTVEQRMYEIIYDKTTFYGCVGIRISEIKLDNIKVTTDPTKMEYLEGEEFDPTGMVITATYSDETTKIITDWTYSPDGALKKGDQIVISYTEGEVNKTVTVSINVKNDMLSLEITTAPTKTEYMVGETFDPTGMVLTATYENGGTKEIKLSEVEYNTAPLTAEDTVITITYNGFEVKQEITFAKGVFIEAEDGFIVSSTVVISDDSIVGGVNTASGGKYIGNMRADDYVTFSFISDKAGTGDIAFRLASQYLKEDHNWDPIWMGDCQFNKICEFYVNGEKYNISDDAILPGGGGSGGEPTDDLWFNWKEVKFTNISFIEGRNDIMLKFIEHDYADCSQSSFNNVFTANIDSLIVTSAECTISPCDFYINEEYKLTSVDMVVEDGVPYLVYTGTNLIYRDYNESELAAAIKLNLSRSSDWKTFLENGAGRTMTVDANGNFTLKVDISSASSDGYYMLHFGLPINENNGQPQDAKVANGVTVATKEDGSNKTFQVGKLIYELVPTNNELWGLIVVKVTTSSEYNFTETTKLVVEDGQVYFVIESTWVGYTQEEALAKCTTFNDFQELWVYSNNYGTVEKTVDDENSRKVYINVSDLPINAANHPYFSHTNTGNMAIKVSENSDDLTVIFGNKKYTLSNNVEPSTDDTVSWTNGLTIIHVTQADVTVTEAALEMRNDVPCLVLKGTCPDYTKCEFGADFEYFKNFGGDGSKVVLDTTVTVDENGNFEVIIDLSAETESLKNVYAVFTHLLVNGGTIDVDYANGTDGVIQSVEYNGYRYIIKFDIANTWWRYMVLVSVEKIA